MFNWLEIDCRQAETMTAAYTRALFTGTSVGVVIDAPRSAAYPGTNVWSPPT